MASTSNTNSNSKLQEPLLPQQHQQTPPPTHVIYVANEESRRKRNVLGSAACIFILLVILLLTFLIPRGPSIALSGGAVTISSRPNSPLFINSSFLFTNNNFYSSTYTDLKFGLYTLSDLGQIGSGAYYGPIKVKARSSRVINVGIETPPGTALKIMNYCSQNPNLIMYTANSTVHAECSLRDFGYVNVYSPFGAVFQCPTPPSEGLN